MQFSHHRVTFLVCSALLTLIECEQTVEKVVLETSQGKLLGVRSVSRAGKSYLSFKGIPFGEIVTRFEPAILASSWDGVKDATQPGNMCPQFSRATQTVVGEEDCLFVNVFTPERAVKNSYVLDEEKVLLPVVVFIHGGAYQFGTGSDYGGGYFVDEDTILVTMNYRMGALGFLSTGDDVIQGNAGLKDQSLSLRWIQEHILSFGGDKGRVTLMGTSAGGASVSFQVLSPYSSGLFHGAQTISGSVLNSWSLHPNPVKSTEELAEILDCPIHPSSALAECLRQTDFKKIISVRLAKWNVDPLCQFSPVVEILRPGQQISDVFLAEEPLKLLEEGRFNKVPIITGVTKDEGLLFHAAGIMKNPELQRNMNEDWNTVAPITLLYDHHAPPEQLVDISRRIRGYYFGGGTIGRETFKNLTNLYSDRYFNHGVKKAALLMAKFTPVYPFILGFQGEWSILNLYYGDVYKEPLGVSHGDDMRLIFNSARFPEIPAGSEMEQFSKQVVRLYASFAKTGNLMDAMTSWKTTWLPIGIEEVKRSRMKWFYMDVNPKMILEPFTERVDFWDKIEAQFANLRVESENTVDRNEL